LPLGWRRISSQQHPGVVSLMVIQAHWRGGHSAPTRLRLDAVNKFRLDAVNKS
jgi:hypothetical protein